MAFDFSINSSLLTVISFFLHAALKDTKENEKESEKESEKEKEVEEKKVNKALLTMLFSSCFSNVKYYLELIN